MKPVGMTQFGQPESINHFANTQKAQQKNCSAGKDMQQSPSGFLFLRHFSLSEQQAHQIYIICGRKSASIVRYTAP